MKNKLKIEVGGCYSISDLPESNVKVVYVVSKDQIKNTYKVQVVNKGSTNMFRYQVEFMDEDELDKFINKDSSTYKIKKIMKIEFLEKVKEYHQNELKKLDHQIGREFYGPGEKYAFYTDLGTYLVLLDSADYNPDTLTWRDVRNVTGTIFTPEGEVIKELDFSNIKVYEVARITDNAFNKGVTELIIENIND